MQHPQFYDTPAYGSAALSTAETDLSGTPGDVATVLTAGVKGTRITTVVAMSTAAGAQAAKVVRLWVYDGATYRLFDEITLAAVTQSATVACQRGERTYTDLVLPTGASLRATTSVTEAVTVQAFGGHY